MSIIYVHKNYVLIAAYFRMTTFIRNMKFKKTRYFNSNSKKFEVLLALIMTMTYSFKYFLPINICNGNI